MADIRRDVGDVNANTFIQQGVVDTSAAEALKGVGEAAMMVDTRLAERRLDKAQEMLRAQYVAGSPAADVYADSGEESDTDDVPLSPEEDRSLKDFERTLNTHVKAHEQGRMNYASYMLRAERLTRLAIARRPGLAQQFRAISGLHTDSFEVRHLAETEDALEKASAAAAKSAADERQKTFELQRKELLENGFAHAMNFQNMDSPGWKEYYESVFPAYQKKKLASTQLAMAEEAVKLTGLQRDANRDVQNARWTAQAENVLASVGPVVESIRFKLTQAGQDKDPAAVRSIINEATAALDQQIVELQVGGANGTVSPEVYSSTMDRLNKMRAQMAGVLNGSSDTELVQNWNTLAGALQKQALYSNSDYLRYSTVLNDLPDGVAAQVQNAMGKTTLSIVADVLADTGNPTEQATHGAAVVRDWVIAALPDGSATPADPVAVGKMADSFVGVAASFLTQPETEFRAEYFTANPVTHKAGFVKALSTHLPQLQKVLPQDKKQELAASVAAVTGHQTRLLAARLYTVAPSLRGKIVARYDDPSGNLFVLKPGTEMSSLNELERRQLTAHNRAAQLPLIKGVLAGLTGGKPADVAALIGQAYQPGQEAAQTAVQARARARQAPRTAQPRAGSQGASGPRVGETRTYQGVTYRFKGGANVKANWEPVDG